MTFTFAGRVGWLVLVGGLSLGCSDEGGVIGGSAPSGGNAGTTSSGGNSDGTAGTTTTSGASGSGAQAGGSGGESATNGGGGMGGTSVVPGSDGGSPGTGDGGANPATPSAGCGMAAGQALNSWVEQPKLSVNAKDRQWWVWLPTDYNPMRAYPVVFTFHGCGSPDNIVPIQKNTGSNAIVVRGTGITGGCWALGATGDDVKFFDSMLADLQAKRCVDSSRVFATGYSSGSWLVNTLDCERGDKLRATATVSGGVAVDTTKCVKAEYGRMFIHDQADPSNDFVTAGNKAELARLVAANHCMATAPVAEDPAPCARYQGCDIGYPVVMCPTMGKGHDRRDDLAPPAFWKFFSSF